MRSLVGVVREQKTDESIYRYSYQGQYAEKDLETGWNHFELREYDPVIGRVTTIDPARQFYSPYVWIGNNPVGGTDPTGGESPIYDMDGNFLGTDDQGVQGEAILMEANQFTQGMSHASALEAGLTFDEFHELFNSPNSTYALETELLVMEHQQGLSSRPDWDGFLTLDEANEWYRNGNGEPLYVDASRINLSPMEKGDFNGVGDSKYINFLDPRTFNKEAGLVYGTIKLTLLNHSGSVKLGGKNNLLDVYNFDQQSGRPFRNIATWIGQEYAGQGTTYKIYNYGMGKIK